MGEVCAEVSLVGFSRVESCLLTRTHDSAPGHPHTQYFGYRAFGLYLLSDLPIPGLVESPNVGLPEISLFLGSQPLDFDPSAYQEIWYESSIKNSSGTPALVISTTGAGLSAFWLKYQDGTNIFLRNNASRIWVTWGPESCVEEAATYLLGPVMAIVAQLRGTICLHGSAVAIDGQAIALLGPQSAGKSTSAAAFARAG